MDTFRWNQSFQTGIATVDEQHHRLVDLINAFSELLAKDVIEIDSVDRVLEKLADYANYHFTEEEAMMCSVGIDARHLTTQSSRTRPLYGGRHCTTEQHRQQ